MARRHPRAHRRPRRGSGGRGQRARGEHRRPAQRDDHQRGPGPPARPGAGGPDDAHLRFGRDGTGDPGTCAGHRNPWRRRAPHLRRRRRVHAAGAHRPALHPQRFHGGRAWTGAGEHRLRRQRHGHRPQAPGALAGSGRPVHRPPAARARAGEPAARGVPAPRPAGPGLRASAARIPRPRGDADDAGGAGQPGRALQLPVPGARIAQLRRGDRHGRRAPARFVGAPARSGRPEHRLAAGIHAPAAAGRARQLHGPGRAGTGAHRGLPRVPQQAAGGHRGRARARGLHALAARILPVPGHGTGTGGTGAGAHLDCLAQPPRTRGGTGRGGCRAGPHRAQRARPRAAAAQRAGADLPHRQQGRADLCERPLERSLGGAARLGDRSPAAGPGGPGRPGTGGGDAGPPFPGRAAHAPVARALAPWRRTRARRGRGAAARRRRPGARLRRQRRGRDRARAGRPAPARAAGLPEPAAGDQPPADDADRPGPPRGTREPRLGAGDGLHAGAHRGGTPPPLPGRGSGQCRALGRRRHHAGARPALRRRRPARHARAQGRRARGPRRRPRRRARAPSSWPT